MKIVMNSDDLDARDFTVNGNKLSDNVDFVRVQKFRQKATRRTREMLRKIQQLGSSGEYWQNLSDSEKSAWKNHALSAGSFGANRFNKVGVQASVPDSVGLGVAEYGASQNSGGLVGVDFSIPSDFFYNFAKITVDDPALEARITQKHPQNGLIMIRSPFEKNFWRFTEMSEPFSPDIQVEFDYQVVVKDTTLANEVSVLIECFDESKNIIYNDSHNVLLSPENTSLHFSYLFTTGLSAGFDYNISLVARDSRITLNLDNFQILKNGVNFARDSEQDRMMITPPNRAPDVLLDWDFRDNPDDVKITMEKVPISLA